ncbi:hypothetical protein J4P90_07390 [Bacillus sp. SY8(2021)]|uniref:Uncharacterized protein n=1 Tax=Bacillus arachidis TaxID=2819290 RepID=A0ABS3NW25_9BACI|nr:hypothetical protein [Bacillus arachidis]
MNKTNMNAKKQVVMLFHLFLDKIALKKRMFNPSRNRWPVVVKGTKMIKLR